MDRVRELSKKGIPVLVGTRSVIASDHLSGLFAGIGLDHFVLSAAQDKRRPRSPPRPARSAA